MNDPAIPTPGAAISADWGRDVALGLRAVQIRRGVGSRVSQYGDQGVGVDPIDKPGARVFQEPRTAPPKMFRIGCEGSFIYVRNGKLLWSFLALPVGVHDDDWTFIFQDDERTFIDCSAGWDVAESRIVFVALDMRARTASLRMTGDAGIPVDDPVALIVRWPLAEISIAEVTYPAATPEAEPETLFQPSVVDVWHDGAVKIPSTYGGPL